ncbi:gas vesicle protein GvpJ [Kitasatospora sp. NPDC004240]
MSVAPRPSPRPDRPSSGGLGDVIDLILDKGLIVDAYVRVSLIGIELLTIDARIVIASVDTYLRFAEAVNRLDLTGDSTEGLSAPTGATDRGVDRGVSQNEARGALGASGETTGDALDRVRQPEEEEEPQDRPRRRQRSGSSRKEDGE